ncbi:MAG TPA: hypothetical protein VNX21_03735 [Candidatus Thermoplasmatota archaeon]|nr:hypothetical protein [Candidatus Thermoplasmatota archaeon]
MKVPGTDDPEVLREVLRSTLPTKHVELIDKALAALHSSHLARMAEIEEDLKALGPLRTAVEGLKAPPRRR